EAGQHVIGHGEQHQVRGREDARRVGEPGGREVLPDPVLGLLGDGRRGDYRVTGARQRTAERGPGPARPDNPDLEASRMLISSSLHQYRTAPSYAGQCPDKDSPASTRRRRTAMPDHTSPRPHLVWLAGPPVSAGYLPSGPRAQRVPALRARWFGRFRPSGTAGSAGSGPRGPRHLRFAPRAQRANKGARPGGEPRVNAR